MLCASAVRFSGKLRKLRKIAGIVIRRLAEFGGECLQEGAKAPKELIAATGGRLGSFQRLFYAQSLHQFQQVFRFESQKTGGGRTISVSSR